MPEKPLKSRLREARRRGTAPVIKASDEGKSTGSRHHAKKSSGVVGPVGMSERSVAPRSTPGGGQRRRASRSSDRERELWRAENAASGGGRGRPFDLSEPHTRPPARTKGRKKAPSQAAIKRLGGPKDRPALHGG